MPEDLTEPTLKFVITTDLRTDGDTQPRRRLNDTVVERYAEEMQAGLWEFAKSSDPITAFFDGQWYWLASGFHRVAAAKKARVDELQVDVRQGGQRDAILYSVGANATHGYPRSSDDKRRAVSRLLGDTEWLKWSDREIARRCSVTPTFVGILRASLSTVDSERTYTTKHGTIATMDTSAIGGKSKPPTLPAAPTVQLEIFGAETERAGISDVTDLGEAPKAANDAKPAAKPLETEYDRQTQRTLRVHLPRKEFSYVSLPCTTGRSSGADVCPEHLMKVRRQMECHRQWVTDFFAALDEAPER